MNSLAFTFKAQDRNTKIISLIKTCFKLRKQIFDLKHSNIENSLKALNKLKNEKNEILD